MLLALLSCAATATALGARSALGSWRPAETRSDSGGPLQITSERVRDLYPGVTRELLLTLHNTDRRRSVLVGGVHVRDGRTTKRGCAASRRNLRIRQFAGRPFRIPPRAVRRVSVWLTMPKTVANACQRAVFKLHYTAQVAATTRAR